VELNPWPIAPGCHVRSRRSFRPRFLLDILHSDGQGASRATTDPGRARPARHAAVAADLHGRSVAANGFTLSNALMLVLQ
jgi:hypothetical protein